jgi:hypothetical protein
MGIKYDLSPVGAIGNLAIQGGLAEYAKTQQDRKFRADAAQFEAAQRAAQQASQQAFAAQQAERAREAAAAQNWQNFQQNAFLRAQGNAQNAWNQQAQFDRQRMAQGAVDMRQAERQKFAWQAGGAEDTERDLMRQLSEIGKQRLTPAGRTKYTKLMQSFNAMRANRTKLNPPMDKYGEMLETFANDLAGSGLESDIQPMPKPLVEPLATPDGKPTGAYTITEPNGHSQVWEQKAKETPLDLSTPEKIQDHLKTTIQDLPGVGKVWVNPKTGEPKPVKDAKEVDPYEQLKKRFEVQQKAADLISKMRSADDEGGITPEQIRSAIEEAEDDEAPELRQVIEDLKKISPNKAKEFEKLSWADRKKRVKQAMENPNLDLLQGIQDVDPRQQGMSAMQAKRAQPEGGVTITDIRRHQGMSPREAQQGAPAQVQQALGQPVQDEGAFFEVPPQIKQLAEQTGLPVVESIEQLKAMKLQSGDSFIAPDGKIKTVP